MESEARPVQDKIREAERRDKASSPIDMPLARCRDLRQESPKVRPTGSATRPGGRFLHGLRLRPPSRPTLRKRRTSPEVIRNAVADARRSNASAPSGVMSFRRNRLRTWGNPRRGSRSPRPSSTERRLRRSVWPRRRIFENQMLTIKDRVEVGMGFRREAALPASAAASRVGARVSRIKATANRRKRWRRYRPPRHVRAPALGEGPPLRRSLHDSIVRSRFRKGRGKTSSPRRRSASRNCWTESRKRQATPSSRRRLPRCRSVRVFVAR